MRCKLVNQTGQHLRQLSRSLLGVDAQLTGKIA